MLDIMGDKFTFTEEEKLKAAATLKDLRIILGEDFPEKEMIKLQE